jgi:hypothetical protein
MRIAIFLLSALCFWNLSTAQTITHGPLVGGVTDSSARIYYRTDVPAAVLLEVDTDSLFPSPFTVNVNTQAVNQNVTLIDLAGLQSDQRYYYRASVGGIPHIRGTFKTFPPVNLPGYYKVVVGSCNYHDFYSGGGATSPDTYYNDVLFGSIVDFDPHVVLHLGDWNYPPSAFGWQYNLNDSLVAESFSLRYSDYNFSTHIMPNLPIDFIYDDDYSQNGCAGWTYPTVTTGTDFFGGTYYILEDQTMPNGIHDGAIRGYFNNFPGYPQTDTSACHHSFRLGNIEFFVVDTRLAKDPVHEAFTFQPLLYTYTFNPPPGHSTLGQMQKAWLLNELANSDADWKVICSSVVFNQNFGNLMSLLIPAQIVSRQVIELATAIAYMWPGYPEDSDDLMNTIQNNNIKNVIMLSGDTHSSMMDDGSNSGIPELSASGWAAGNEAYLNWSIDSAMQTLGISFAGVEDFLWNGGGSGIGNTNFSDTYGTLEFFHTDSLRMCVVDEFDQTLACQTILFESDPTSAGSHAWVPQSNVLLLYPNPSKSEIRLQIAERFVSENLHVSVYTMEGKKVLEQPVADHRNAQISLRDLPPGTYLLHLTNGKHSEQRKFVKH